MRREGSAFQGLGVVMLKELSDHLTGIRMIVMEWLVVLMAVGVVYTGIQQIREVSAEDPFLFLRLFTRAGEGLPSFVSVLSFLVPLVAIGIGFDVVNSERNQRTLSRILAQPIYRDALLFGKFLAGNHYHCDHAGCSLADGDWSRDTYPRTSTRSGGGCTRGCNVGCDSCLRWRVASACAFMFNSFSFGSNCGARRVGALAFPHDALAVALAVCGRPLCFGYSNDT